MAEQPIVIRSEPGIKRDGTRFEGSFYTDGEWVRFQRGLPRKIGGYRRVTNEANGIVRQFHTQAENNIVYTHIGHANGVDRFTLDLSGNASTMTDRTPLLYTPNDNMMWQFDAMFDGAGSGTIIIAHGTQTANDISSGINLPAYFGNIYDTARLTAIPTSGVCGGIVVLHPYLFMYCKNGFIKWSDANDPTNFSSGDAGDGFITNAKIVKGMPLRGGGESPAGLFWSLDSLIRASYTGGPDIFRFDTITSSTSILAANSVIEYDGIYFWCGIDRFIYYNGVVQDLPNTMNSNFFFDNLNYAHANKIFAFKVPRFGEIWWCFPKGTSTECNHAVIFNVREQTWYDTPLPEGGRSAGIYAQVFRSPLLSGVRPVGLAPGSLRLTEDDDERITEDGDYRITDTGPISYKIWRHETGVDAIDGTSAQAIRSYFQTSDITLANSQTPSLAAMRITAIEPDFVQTGNMSVQVTGYINAKSQDVISDPYIFPAVAQTPAQEVVKMKEVRRRLKLRFESNTVGGDYQMGETIAHVGPADSRYQS
jgi:hypothetical protein